MDASKMKRTASSMDESDHNEKLYALVHPKIACRYCGNDGEDKASPACFFDTTNKQKCICCDIFHEVQIATNGSTWSSLSSKAQRKFLEEVTDRSIATWVADVEQRFQSAVPEAAKEYVATCTRGCIEDLTIIAKGRDISPTEPTDPDWDKIFGIMSQQPSHRSPPDDTVPNAPLHVQEQHVITDDNEDVSLPILLKKPIITAGPELSSSNTKHTGTSVEATRPKYRPIAPKRRAGSSVGGSGIAGDTTIFDITAGPAPSSSKTKHTDMSAKTTRPEKKMKLSERQVLTPPMEHSTVGGDAENYARKSIEQIEELIKANKQERALIATTEHCVKRRRLTEAKAQYTELTNRSRALHDEYNDAEKTVRILETENAAVYERMLQATRIKNNLRQRNYVANEEVCELGGEIQALENTVFDGEIERREKDLLETREQLKQAWLQKKTAQVDAEIEKLCG